MRSRNTVVKNLGADVIAASPMTSDFNMANVNVKDGDLSNATPALKSNAGD